MKIPKIKHALPKDLNHGFTLLELIVVVAVLTILGGMAAPSVIAYIRTAHVNEGKALLNAAVSDCLRTAGSTPQNLATTTPVTLQEALAGTRATPLGYTIEKDPHCSTGLSLKATTPGMIDLYAEVKSDGTVIKKAATQENDTSSSSQLNCEQWGGKANCQDAAEIARQKAAAIAAALAAAEAERARLAAIEK
jgi:prepilin-type N-terminal cleavage/methylation domain-containing protein